MHRWSLLQTVSPFLCELSHLLRLLLEVWDLLTLQQPLYLLRESLDPAIQKKHVIVTFLVELCGVLDAHSFVEVVDHHNLIFLVLVEVQFWNRLVSLDVGSWIVQCLFDVELLILLTIAQVEQQKLRVEVHW